MKKLECGERVRQQNDYSVIFLYRLVMPNARYKVVAFVGRRVSRWHGLGVARLEVALLGARETAQLLKKNGVTLSDDAV
jgi:hypothetical protein